MSAPWARCAARNSTRSAEESQTPHRRDFFHFQHAGNHVFRKIVALFCAELRSAAGDVRENSGRHGDSGGVFSAAWSPALGFPEFPKISHSEKIVSTTAFQSQL
jgi:hypothetical protein